MLGSLVHKQQIKPCTKCDYSKFLTLIKMRGKERYFWLFEKPHTIPYSYWARRLHLWPPLKPILQFQKCLVKTSGFTFRSFFLLPPFPRHEMVKSILAEWRKKKKKEVAQTVEQVWHQLPIATGCASHKSDVPWPAARGTWAAWRGLTVMEDFPAVFPCFSKDLDSFLWETICTKEMKGGDIGHITASLFLNFSSTKFCIHSSAGIDIYVH